MSTMATMPSDAGRAEEKPPFLSWKALYIVVAAALVLEIIAFAAMRWIYR